jgi:hypothetical protein
MDFMPVVFAFFLALLLSLFLVYGFRNRGPWGSVWTFWLILFLGIWAAALWVYPTGPMLYGVSWIPLLFVGFFFAILLLAAIPTRSSRQPGVDEEAYTQISSETRALSIFFWLLVLILVIAIILGYWL